MRLAVWCQASAGASNFLAPALFFLYSTSNLRLCAYYKIFSIMEVGLLRPGTHPYRKCMKYSTQIIHTSGKRYLLTWRSGSDVAKYGPITHVHGIIFNTAGEILIGRPGPRGPWTIFGGKIEAGETLEVALRRELLEEGDAVVGKICILGVQEVLAVNEPRGDKNPYFQVRCAAMLSELLPQTPDPDALRGITWERRFVPSKDVEQYVPWGENGHAMFEEAIQFYATEFSRKV